MRRRPGGPRGIGTAAVRVGVATGLAALAAGAVAGAAAWTAPGGPSAVALLGAAIVGLALAALADGVRPPRSVGRAVAPLAAIGSLLGAATLIVGGAPQAATDAAPAVPGSSPVVSALCAAVLGVAFALRSTASARRTARGLAVVTGFAGAGATLSVVLGHVQGPTPPPGALAAASGVVLLATHLVLRDPRRVPWRWFAGLSPGARAARLGLPLAIAIPVLSTVVVYVAREHGDLRAQDAASLAAVLAAAGSVLLVVLMSHRLDRHSDLRELADEAVRGASSWEAVGAFRADARGRLVEADERFLGILGVSLEDVRATPWIDVVAERTRPTVQAAWREALEQQRTFRSQVVIARPDGTERVLHVALGPVRLSRAADGADWVGTTVDVTRIHAVEDQLLSTERRRQAAIDRSPAGVAELSLDGRWISANRAVCRMLGVEEDELRGRHLDDVLVQDDAARTAQSLEAVREGLRSDGSGELTYRHADGGLRRVRFTSVPMLDAEGEPDHLMVHMFDVTARHRAEGELQRLLDEDAPTGLHSRQWFERALAGATAATRRGGGPTAVVLVDVDRFHDLNDGYGAAAGDRVLQGIAELLRREGEGVGEAARVGGDELAVLLPDVELDHASVVARRIVDAVAAASWDVADGRLKVTVSAGVASLTTADDGGPEDEDATALMARAAAALRDAKEAGAGRLKVARGHHGGTGGSRERLALADRLRRAIEHDGLSVRYQPIADMADGRVRHMEALVRLTDRPGDAPTAPGRFLDVAERYGLLADVDARVREIVVGDLGAGRIPPEVAVSVNVSAATVDDPAAPAALQRLLSRAGVDGARLLLEVTETTAIRDVEVARRFAERTTALGCRLALDDFGTGFASFASLKQLPYDVVKIDGSYVRDLIRDPTDQLLVRALVDLARGLGMQTVAEVIEDDATWRVLHGLGVDLGQGYVIGRPEPLEAALRTAAAFVAPTSDDPGVRVVRPERSAPPRAATGTAG